MENKKDAIQLSSGHSMPRFGLGTWGSTDKDVLIKAAVEQGYRLFDCASRYGNEEMVGEALKKVGETVKREDMFVVSKLWHSDAEDVEAACRLSLKNLGLEYLDLYLVHWPVALNNTEGKFERIKIP